MVKKSYTKQQFPNALVVQLKRYGYSAMISVGILSGITVLIFGSPTFKLSPATELFDYIVYPIVTVAGIFLIRAMMKGRIDVEKFEKPILFSGIIFMISKFGLTLLSAPTILSLAYVESWYWMMIGAWALSFLIYPFLPAIYINLGVYFSMFTIVVTNIFIKAEPSAKLDYLSDVFASNFRLGSTLILLGILGYIKHQWAFVEREAMLLRKLAHQDSLMGLPNRRLLNEVLNVEVNDSRNSLTVILFDLDGFKEINDQFGHTAGDEVLRQVAQLARNHVRASDLVGRWGGEEFLIVCPNTTLPEGARLAERLRRIFASRLILHGQSITSSFGVAQLQPEETIESLIARADEALYEAKGQGRNLVISSVEANGSGFSDHRVKSARSQR